MVISYGDGIAACRQVGELRLCLIGRTVNAIGQNVRSGIGWGLKLLRPISINRGAGHRAVKQVIEQGKERLADGLWIIVFPEGTRTVVGETRKFGISGFVLAAETGKYVVPLIL